MPEIVSLVAVSSQVNGSSSVVFNDIAYITECCIGFCIIDKWLRKWLSPE
jgi:hypothetical protein